ncbi:MAG: hypothetical protein DRI99_08295 [Candidatus Aminicenantes bacterium]|nr:MAG: hypothetical protein DRI99_08295 [Candidatus Aminicenantes bacterium]
MNILSIDRQGVWKGERLSPHLSDLKIILPRMDSYFREVGLSETLINFYSSKKFRHSFPIFLTSILIFTKRLLLFFTEDLANSFLTNARKNNVI